MDKQLIELLCIKTFSQNSGIDNRLTYTCISGYTYIGYIYNGEYYNIRIMSGTYTCVNKSYFKTLHDIRNDKIEEVLKLI